MYMQYMHCTLTHTSGYCKTATHKLIAKLNTISLPE